MSNNKSIGKRLKGLREDLDNATFGCCGTERIDDTYIGALDAIIKDVWTDKDDADERSTEIADAIERAHGRLRKGTLNSLRKEAAFMNIRGRSNMTAEDLHGAIVGAMQWDFDHEQKTTYGSVMVGDKVWISHRERFFPVIKRSEMDGDTVWLTCDPGPNVKRFSAYGEADDVVYILRDTIVDNASPSGVDLNLAEPTVLTSLGVTLVKTTMGKIIRGDKVVHNGISAEVEGIRPRSSNKSRIDLVNEATIGGDKNTEIWRFPRKGE
jgi:hypothetical protein